MIRKAGWFDIYVDDMDRAQKFYETVLATSLSTMTDPTNPTAQMEAFEDDYSGQGATGSLVKLDHAKPGVGGTTIYFTCEDCSVEQSRVEAAGGSIVRPRFQIGEHGFVSLAMDTEGNMIGFHSRG